MTPLYVAAIEISSNQNMYMKKSEWLDCQGNEFFPKQKGTPSLVKIEHKNTATLDSARSKKKSKVAVLQLSTISTTQLRVRQLKPLQMAVTLKICKRLN